MNKETRQAIKELSFYSSLGFSMVLAIFLGLFGGIYLDKKFDTLPWLTLIGLGLGIGAAYKNIALAIKKSRDL